MNENELTEYGFTRLDSGRIVIEIESDDLYRLKSALFGAYDRSDARPSESRYLEIRDKIPAGSAVRKAEIELTVDDWITAGYALETAADMKAEAGAGASARFIGELAHTVFYALESTTERSGVYPAFAGTADKLREDIGGKWATA